MPVKLVIKNKVEQPQTPPTTPVVEIDPNKKAIAYGYYGLKINENTLTEKKKTILEVLKDFGITTAYVIGRDQALCSRAKPHYHIHFKDDRTIDALRKHKQKVMSKWGHTTKLYPPKAKIGDWMAWCGYAVKEQKIAISEDIDQTELTIQSRIQAEFKKSKMNWGQRKEEKKQEKKDLKTRIYDVLDAFRIESQPDEGTVRSSMKWYQMLAVPFCRAYRLETEGVPNPNMIRNFIWTYMIKREIATDADYVNYYL